MSRRVISAYTPSNTDPETRRRIFVQRHKLLDRAVRWCEESIETGDKHHLLFVGPRGSGKTHLVSMIRDRLVANEGLADKTRIAWLGEDSVFTGLIDVALEIADKLAEERPDEFEFDYRRHAQGLDAGEAAQAVLHEVVRRLGDKPLLLIMENLDRAFHGLGDTGQKRWRAFLQETGRIATVATSQQLFEGVSSRDAAFFGFFEIIHLAPLSVDDARQLMANIARENENFELLKFLETPEGRYRVRALQHLAGGNHRMYVMLSEFLTKESLDGLVEAFEQLAEDLTPYFQERVRSLSPQQARIVQTLCAAPGAMSVKEVAADAFIAERNVSKQLGDLKQKGYVVSEKQGKESYYEMAEPLMRLCLEVKNQRGKPLRLVAAFLRAWYATDAARGERRLVAVGPGEAPRTAAYRELAMQTTDDFQDTVRRKLNSEFEASFQANELDDALKLAEELIYSDRLTGLTQKSRVLREQGRLKEALIEVHQVLTLPTLTPYQRAAALQSRGVAYMDLGDLEKAIADYSAVIQMEGASVNQKADALVNRGVTHGRLGDSQQEIADHSAVIEMTNASAEAKAMALYNRGLSHRRLGDSQQEIADYSAVIEMTNASAEMKVMALVDRGATHVEYGNLEMAITDFSSVIEMAEVPVNQKAIALVNRGITYGELRDSEREIADFTAVAEMNEAPAASKTHALFCVPEAMIPMSPIKASLAALLHAFAAGDPDVEEYGGAPGDVLAMVLRRGPTDWPEFIAGLVPIYAEHRMLDRLGSGLIESIESLVEGGFSASQLDVWNSAWKQFGDDHDELAIPLAALDAAVRVIKTGDERPLFDLPLEIRQIVRPLLNKTLGDDQS